MAGSNRNLYLAAAVACMTASLFGYSVGFIGGVLVLPSFLHHFGLDSLMPNELASAQAMTVTSWLVGTLVGVLMAMPIYSRMGRKPCLLFCAVLYIAGASLQVSGIGGVTVFDVGRVVNGIGVGAGTLVSPLYISEISTPATRGMLMSGYQVSVQLSALVGFWGAYIAHQVFADSSKQQYLIPVAMQLVPGVLLVIGTMFVVEAPRFLAEQSKAEDLTSCVSWLRGLPPTSAEVTAEVETMLRSTASIKRLQLLREKSFWQELKASTSLRRRLVVGVGLMIAQNMAGLNAINYYAPSIFRSAGFSSVNSMLFLTGLFGFVKLIAAAAFMSLFVRVKGNRFWLNVGSAVCAVSMYVLAICIWRMTSNTDKDSRSTLTVEGVTAVLCVYVFSFFFGISLGPISWNVCGEVFPSRLSAQCCTITTFTQWLFQIVIASVTPRLIANIGWGTYVFYGVCCTISLIWCWVAVPETRGVALGRDMDVLFGKQGTLRGSGEPLLPGSGSEVAEEIEEAEEAMTEVNETSPLLATSLRRHRRSSVALIV